MITLTEAQTRVLESLLHYRFLTHSQMVRLGIGSPSHVRFTTLRLRQKALIESVSYPFTPKEGRLEKVHHLTMAGASLLADLTGNEASLTFRPVTAVYHRDYDHRKRTIDFQIALTQAVATHERLKLVRFDRYFDKTGANRGTGQPLRSDTRIDLDADFSLVPDANFVIARLFDAAPPAAYTLEVANGRDTKRVLGQIERHAAALEDKALATKYDLPSQRTHQMLFVFSNYQLLQSVRERFVEVKAAQPLSACYRFGYLPYLLEDPLRCWKQPKYLSDDWFHLLTGKPVEHPEKPAKASIT